MHGQHEASQKTLASNSKMDYHDSVLEGGTTLMQPAEYLKQEISESGLVAKSPAMLRVMDLARRVAAADSTLLITGESGTGKERIARFIHHFSPRSQGPFVAINCGAMPEELLESELFGHAKGAFTGATADKEGLFEAARGGTIFLDEIGETSLNLQVKLLRVLQDHCIRKVGSNRVIQVDARVIAATNRDLEEMIATKQFRKDLYYRLKVIAIEVPPLHRRKEDILPLAHHFVTSGCKTYHCGPCALSAEALDLLLAYSWPGNVRELENAMERAVVLAEGKPKITPADLPPEIRNRAGAPLSEIQTEEVVSLEEMERRYILRVLEKFQGNRTRTAKALGIGPNTLWRKLRTYGVPAIARKETLDVQSTADRFRKRSEK